MSFKEFDLSEYINALEDFKKNNTDAIMKHWGNVENFDLFIRKIKEDEPKVAKLAIKEFGSIEKYTQAMKYNLEHFNEIMEQQMNGDAKKIAQQSDELYKRLTADSSKEVSSDEIQSIVHDIDLLMRNHATTDLKGNGYLNAIMKAYSGDYVKAITYTKFGNGAADYIVKAFQYYIDHKNDEFK